MRCSEVVEVYLALLINNVFCIQCYWNNFCPYRYFSSRTGYSTGRGDIRDFAVIKDCEPISIYGIFRHGQRNPGVKSTENYVNVVSLRDDLIAKHKEGKGSLCVHDIENLQNWQFDQNLEDLHDRKLDSLFEITGVGQRLKEAYKKLLGNLDVDTYTIKSSPLLYIRIFADSFLDGLDLPTLNVNQSRTNINEILTPVDDCEGYINSVKYNRTTSSQTIKYTTTPEYLKSKNKVEERTGLPFDNITFLYDLCRYTWSSLDNKPSPWCAPFDEEDLKIQEYREDLRLYYDHSYGHPWNVEFGQVTLGDLLKTFESEKIKPQKKITAYFSHASMLNMAYSALGLFKDDIPLTADYRDDNRKWRSSNHVIFNANLLVVLNKCNKRAPDNFVVAFYMNEKPLDSICNNGVCTWNEFEQMLRPFENKTFENVCNKDV